MTVISRRTALLGGLGATLAAQAPLRAQAGPMRIGFLTVKTGPLASGGIQMEQGLTLYLKDRNNVLAGRPVQLFTADTGGVPANTRTKTQELVEQDNVSVIIGPLAAFEALAIDDLHAGEADSRLERGGGGGHHAAPSGPLVRPLHVVLRAMRPAARRLCGQGAGL